MLYAIISDIHGNLEALEAVLERIESLPVERVYCLGDVVGYGADPAECMRRALGRANAAIRGNHDKAAAGLLELTWFNRMAREAIEWTRRALGPQLLERLRLLPQGPIEVDDGILLCHGTPYDEDVYMTDDDTIEQSYAFLDAKFPGVRFCFHGHTHFPLVISRNKGAGRVNVATGVEKTHLEKGTVYLINPGSVGQPRDGITLASFGILDATRMVYSNVRVPYRIDIAQRKIRQARLPELLAERLGQGK